MLNSSRHILGAALLCATAVGCPSRTDPPPITPPVLRSQARTQALPAGEAVVAFARMYGVVRYFHPSEAAANADWNTIAATGVAAVHQATTYGELAAILESVFGPLTHGMQIWVDPEPRPPAPQRPPRSAGLVYWQHQGFEGTPISLFRPPYSSVRVTPKTRYERRFAEAPDPAVPLELTLAGPVHLRLPLTLPEAVASATPPTPIADVPVLDITDIDEVAVREAIMVDVWSTLRHFYPYQSEVSVPWDEVLLEALARTQDDKSVEDVVDSIRTLTRALHDGHARVERDGMRGRGWLPVRLACLGDDVVVTASDTPTLQAGDRIRTIDGQPARQRLRAIADRLSGSERWRTFRACTWEGAQGPFDGPVALELQRDDLETSVTLRYSHRAVVPPMRPEAFSVLDDGVIYVDLTRLSWTDLKPRLTELAAAPGLVFDMRGYPVHNDDILDLLLEQPESAKWMHVPRFIRPGGEPVSYADLGWQRSPSQPHIEAPVVFLTSAAAISYAESILAYVQTHQLGTIMGTTTAGANGDIVRHDSLAGFYVVFSGMRVTRHDGSPFHNEGISPDVVLEPTVAGVRGGADQLLGAALARVRAEMAARTLVASPP